MYLRCSNSVFEFVLKMDNSYINKSIWGSMKENYYFNFRRVLHSEHRTFYTRQKFLKKYCWSPFTLACVEEPLQSNNLWWQSPIAGHETNPVIKWVNCLVYVKDENGIFGNLTLDIRCITTMGMDWWVVQSKKWSSPFFNPSLSISVSLLGNRHSQVIKALLVTNATKLLIRTPTLILTSKVLMKE